MIASYVLIASLNLSSIARFAARQSGRLSASAWVKQPAENYWVSLL
jgi:hypothetical protein